MENNNNNNLLNIEKNFRHWISLSISLLSSSLIFYHMANSYSIKISKKISSLISCTMIILNIIYSVHNIILFYNDEDYNNIYFYLSLIFIIIEVIICFYIIKDSYFN